jgi:regulator of sigma E protease
MFVIVSIVSMLVVLGIMVLVHEAGHFFAAKACGVRVEVFSIGFGPRLFGITRGDTDYRICLLPLGGFVKMAGEMGGEASSGDPAEFPSRPRWQRIIILLAGPVSNFLLAFALMTGLYMMHNEVDVYLNGPAVVDYVSQNSPAAKAGIQAGDTIVQFGAVKNPDWQQVSIRMGIDGNTTIPVTVARPNDGTTQDVTVRLPLAKGMTKDGPDPTALGLQPRVQPGPLVVHDIEPDYPIGKAGVKPGDKILALNGHPVHSVIATLALLKDNGAKPVDVLADRNGRQMHFEVTPVLRDDETGKPAYKLGFAADPPPFTVQQLPLLAAAKRSYHYNAQLSGYMLEVLHKLFSKPSNIKQLSGPVGIARATGEATMMPGWQPIINLMALISINLGVFNLIPFPPLDGAMILLLLIESVMRHDLNQQVKERVYQVAFVMLILLIVFVTFNDVTRIAGFSNVSP